MSSTSSSEGLGNDRIFSVGPYYKFAKSQFLGLDNIVQCLFNNGLLTDIECRKIAVNVSDDITSRAEIYEIMFTKDAKVLKKILKVFRDRVHPLQNPRILQRIFCYLNYADLSKCKDMCPDWKEMIELLVGSKYDDVNLEDRLLMSLHSKHDKIKKTKCFSDEDDNIAAAFQLMLAINPENDDIMFEKLQIKEHGPVNVQNCLINVSLTGNKTDILIANVMSNHAVLSNIFQFLSLKSINNCRTVCPSWNSVAEPHLRKLSTILFCPDFTPLQFIYVSKYLPLPNLHYNAFKFRDYLLKGEFCEFFTKFGANIRSLDFFLIRGMRSYLSHTCNLTELNLIGPKNKVNVFPKSDPLIMIPWNILQSIKILYLRHIVVDVDRDQDWKRMTPVKVFLHKVYFFIGGCYPNEIILNDYIDFTKVAHANVTSTTKQIQQFDWARDNFDAEKYKFANTSFINAVGKSKSSVHCLKICCQHTFSEKSYISVKQLLIEGGLHSFANLPPSIEKLAICRKTVNTSPTEPFYLPNLKYLSLGAGSGFNFLFLIDNCSNLTALEITSIETTELGMLPRNIKKLKTRLPLSNFNDGDYEPLDLDVLILDNTSIDQLNHLLFDKLRPKVLVLPIKYDNYKDVASFIMRNKNIGKIFVHHAKTVRQPNVFSKSRLSKMVDKVSEYYEFTKECGRAITAKEYIAIHNSLAIKSAMKGLWDTKEEKMDNRSRKDFYKSFQAYAAKIDRNYRYSDDSEYGNDSNNDSYVSINAIYDMMDD